LCLYCHSLSDPEREAEVIVQYVIDWGVIVSADYRSTVGNVVAVVESGRVLIQASLVSRVYLGTPSHKT
jgi:hypothetical protein